MKSSNEKIRPLANHILTIGEDLIQDQTAAIIELVKNAYDADSPSVKITFDFNEKQPLICIEDFGHGMSRKDVINKWLVPSTDYKKKKRTSPNGRIMQGRKGIGRYAASILSRKLQMITVSKDNQLDRHEMSTIFIDWDEFTSNKYLDEIDIVVETTESDRPVGTKLTMLLTPDECKIWTDNKFERLRYELKKLIPPAIEDMNEGQFKLIIDFKEVYTEPTLNVKEEIHPFPILELYDYRIYGDIDESGMARLSFYNNKVINSEVIRIEKKVDSRLCGPVKVDIRVYDREKDSIDHLIQRGLVDSKGNFLSNLEARRLLNSVNGIGVYRNGFRIRPLGDPDNDWLKLNESRVQNPSMKVGSNQVVGYVHITSEEQSGLEENSARDGLKRNQAYYKLVELTKSIIIELESRRFAFRKSLGLSRTKNKVEQEVLKLFDYTELKKTVTSSLEGKGIAKETIDHIEEMIEKDEAEKNIVVEEIKKAIATYQGQATLGKIINVVMHEGRKPLNYFKNQIPNFEFYVDEYLKSKDIEDKKEVDKIKEGIAINSDVLVSLFSKLDPLASKKRKNKEIFSIENVISNVMEVFSGEILEHNIKIEYDIESISYYGWAQDFYAILTNVIDNSIFWLADKDGERSIKISLYSTSNKDWILDIIDSGPGIEKELLQSEVIFEPEFTTKSNGTGLGLAIAGEAASRNEVRLIAISNESGAHIRLIYEESKDE